MADSKVARVGLLDFNTFAQAEGIDPKAEGVVTQKALPPQARPQPDQPLPARPQSNGAQRDAERRQQHQPLLVETPPCRSPSDSLGANSFEANAPEANSIELAAGAFGRVYHGLYGQDDVAVKLISVSPNIPPKELASIEAGILQEINVWHTLKHPNIVQVRSCV
ncbi:unnamed protein product [Closterium sp. NIES-64]|nr:unnamed protein product [Closterium sp. NIES-64]